MTETKEEKSISFETILATAVKIPMVKVNRHSFLEDTFKKYLDEYPDILTEGPIKAGVPRETLKNISSKLIFYRTSTSSLASFAAGIPGGLAMAATIPADILQFFGFALKLAQELSYIYGAEDLWQNGELDMEKIQNQLILYCGVMFGVSSAISGVRVLSAQIAKTTLKKLPQKALTKTFWYPIIKQICKALGVKMTKTTFANGVAKVIPVVGGVISGTLNFASMMPMANRLQKTLDKSIFDYSEAEMEADIKVLSETDDEAAAEPQKELSLKEKLSLGVKKGASGVAGLVAKAKEKLQAKPAPAAVDKDEIFDTIKRMKELLDEGIITQEEFDSKKQELLTKL